MDFVADQLQDGTRFRSLTIVDLFTREAVAIEVGQSLKGDDVVRTLNRLKLDREVPNLQRFSKRFHRGRCSVDRDAPVSHYGYLQIVLGQLLLSQSANRGRQKQEDTENCP